MGARVMQRTPKPDHNTQLRLVMGSLVTQIMNPRCDKEDVQQKPPPALAVMPTLTYTQTRALTAPVPPSPSTIPLPHHHTPPLPTPILPTNTPTQSPCPINRRQPPSPPPIRGCCFNLQVRHQCVNLGDKHTHPGRLLRLPHAAH